MTTKQKNWGKTILSSYNYLQRLCSSIDKLIEDTAVNSYYSYSFIDSRNSITNISSKIINLSNRKIDYINLKILIEHGHLRTYHSISLAPTSAQVLVFHGG